MRQENFPPPHSSWCDFQQFLMANIAELWKHEVGWDISGHSLKRNTQLNSEKWLRYFRKNLEQTQAVEIGSAQWLWPRNTPERTPQLLNCTGRKLAGRQRVSPWHQQSLLGTFYCILESSWHPLWCHQCCSYKCTELSQSVSTASVCRHAFPTEETFWKSRDGCDWNKREAESSWPFIWE